MLRTFCRCKIHRAVITDRSLDYVGSMTIPKNIMEKLDIKEGEQVDVANIENGERWTTYAIPGRDFEFSLNGAAAHLGAIGDKIIIMVYAQLEEHEIPAFKMKVAFMEENDFMATRNVRYNF